MLNLDLTLTLTAAAKEFITEYGNLESGAPNLLCGHGACFLANFYFGVPENCFSAIFTS